MSLTEGMFDPIQTQLRHSIHAVHPRRPPPHKYFNACEVDTHQYILAPTPPLPLQQPPLHTHPPSRRQPALAANSVTHHVGITGVTSPINDDDSSPAPSHATRTAPCRMLPPPPLCATTISLTAGRCPLCAAAATAVYVSLLPHSRCPHLPPFAAMHLTPVPLHFGPRQGCNMVFNRYVTCMTERAVLTVVQT